MPNDELQCLYTTANDVAKHYSMFVNRQRTIVVTVSILAIATCGKLYLENNPSYLAIGAIASWGLFFVASMFFMMRHYRAHALSSMKAATELEELLCEHANAAKGAWNGVTKNVECLDNRLYVHSCYVYGTFIVMEATFFVICVVAACNLLQRFLQNGTLA